MTTALERLEHLLNERDAQIRTMREELELLRCAREGSWWGWREARDTPDIIALPIPRLEFEWMDNSHGRWTCFTVEFRLVLKHLLGHAEIIPLGRTRIEGGGGERTPPNGAHGAPFQLPYRDGAHAAWLSGFLADGDRALPIYGLAPEGPRLITVGEHDHLHTLLRAMTERRS
jgi:hypothetical protein